jgi:O-glycosyl hydrolase
MTETSGEKSTWLEPSSGFPGNGAWSVALKIQQALTAGQESAYLYWQFAEPAAADTSIECLTRQQETTQEPKYVAFKHFSKFIRPGAIAVGVTVDHGNNLAASAYIHPKDRTLTLVLVNKSPDAETAAITLPDDFSNIRSFDMVTSCDRHLWQESDLPPSNQALHLSVPGYGVVTLQGRN